MPTTRPRPLALENVDHLIRFCDANGVDFLDQFAPKIVPDNPETYYRETIVMTVEENIVGFGVLVRSDTILASEIVSVYSQADYEYASETIALTTALLTTVNFIFNFPCEKIVASVRGSDNPCFDIFLEIGATEMDSSVAMINGSEDQEKVLRFGEAAITGIHAGLVSDALDLSQDAANNNMPSELGLELFGFPDDYKPYVRQLAALGN